MRNLSIRMMSGVAYVLLFLSAVLFSYRSYVILILLFSLIALWEFLKLIKCKSSFWYLWIFSIIFPYGIANYLSKTQRLILLLIVLIGLLYLIYRLYSKKLHHSRSVLNKSLLCIGYIILPFSFLIQLPFSEENPHLYLTENYHPYLIIYILLLIWANDTFAYLVGKFFGNFPLFKRISPKKTIEGFLGGFVFSIITACFIGVYNHYFKLYQWIIIAIILTVFGTFGDLVESKFKRQAGVKDSGNILPGHGGLLDRLDSLLFAAPFVYGYIHYFI